MLILHQAARDKMINDAIRTFPDECCGFMFGTDGDDRTISEISIVDNSKEGDKRRRFEISPRDYMNAEIYAEKNKLTLLGIYHSHPNHPSIPSEHDRIAAQPFFSYVIISVNDGKFNSIHSWRLDDNVQFQGEVIFREKPFKRSIYKLVWQQLLSLRRFVSSPVSSQG